MTDLDRVEASKGIIKLPNEALSSKIRFFTELSRVRLFASDETKCEILKFI